MTRAISAARLKASLGRVLKGLKENDRFVVFRRNAPVGVLLSIQDYVRHHPDQYVDVQDFLDTFMEESDAEFQRSLRRARRAVDTGRFLSHAQLKLKLAGKKF